MFFLHITIKSDATVSYFAVSYSLDTSTWKWCIWYFFYPGSAPASHRDQRVLLNLNLSSMSKQRGYKDIVTSLVLVSSSRFIWKPTQQTQNICMTFVQCWTYVEDVGPTWYKCYTNVLCLLGTCMYMLWVYGHATLSVRRPETVFNRWHDIL